MSTAAGNAAGRAPLPLSVAMALTGDAVDLNSLIQVAAISDGPLARDVACAVLGAAAFRTELEAASARRGRAGDLQGA